MNKSVMGIVLALAAGAAAGYWWAQREAPAPGDATAPAERKILYYRNPMNPEITSPVPAKDEMGMDYIPVYADEAPAPKKERKILYYRNPMNPEITSPVPAKDEMGMDYIPVYADESGGDEHPGTVKIDPVMVQNIGVRTARAERRAISRTIRTVARVDYDEQRIARLHPKTEGWVEELFINETGAVIGPDTILLNFYAPQLVSSQQEYVLALDNLDELKRSAYPELREGAERMARIARQRLEFLDVPEHQIRELEQSRKIKKRLHIHSPVGGVVLKIGTRVGDYITPTTEIYQIADLSRVWVLADLYEGEVRWVQVGDAVEMTLPALPGERFEGTVDYLYPYAEGKTRTIKARMVFDNPDLKLRPDLYADVVIHAARTVDAVVVPSEAIVRSGVREIVFCVRAPGKFEPVEVETGVSADGYTQIVSGVAPGEEVVTSAQFLIDSESKLREAAAKMREQ